MKKKYKVVTLHPYTECNLNCSFCYSKKKKEKLSLVDFIKLVPVLAKHTNQVALGGGEPLMKPIFVKNFAAECVKHDIICNLTTNGHLIQEVSKETFKNITLVSISFDKEKINSSISANRVFANIKYLKSIKRDIIVGCNLLLDPFMLEDLVGFVKHLLKAFDRVFVLYPKNVSGPDILKHRAKFLALDTLFPGRVFIDDCTKRILGENKYKNWKTPCHYARDVISIDKGGDIYGCSFENKKPVGKVLNSKNSCKIKIQRKITKRYNCPFIKK